jgi:uncharacterized protein YkwD
MRHARIAVAAGITLVLSMPSLAAAGVPPESAALIAKVNEMRRSSGLPTLRVSDELTGSSRSYARYMLKHDYFGHLASIRAGGNFLSLGETLEWHAGWKNRVRRTVSLWMRSPSHRTVLMSPTFRFIGAGRARGKMGSRRATAWVAQVGARPAEPPVRLPIGG